MKYDGIETLLFGTKIHMRLWQLKIDIMKAENGFGY